MRTSAPGAVCGSAVITTSILSRSGPVPVKCGPKCTWAPLSHPPIAHTRARQCCGRSTSTGAACSPPDSSASTLPALITQFANTRPESSTRSSAAPYQVSRGSVGSCCCQEESNSLISRIRPSIESPRAVQRTVRASISTSISARGSPAITVVRAGVTPLGVCSATNCPYASFIAAKSSRVVRYTRSISTSSKLAPPACRIASTFCNVRTVWAPTSPGCRYSPVAGSTGPCPETCTKPPLCTPWGKVCAGRGASGVLIADLADGGAASFMAGPPGMRNVFETRVPPSVRCRRGAPVVALPTRAWDPRGTQPASAARPGRVRGRVEVGHEPGPRGRHRVVADRRLSRLGLTYEGQHACNLPTDRRPQRRFDVSEIGDTRVEHPGRGPAHRRYVTGWAGPPHRGTTRLRYFCWRGRRRPRLAGTSALCPDRPRGVLS